jgi:hydrogenase maturation factor
VENEPLPVGKLPVDLLLRLLSQAPAQDPRVVLGPGLGIDCAVVEAGPSLLVFKSDPITFATDEIGWYAVQVNANDLATTGATPRWMLVTLLLPEGRTTPALVETIGGQIESACRSIGVTVIGGHTEVTFGLDRPILVGTMIGEVARERLVTPRGCRPGDRILLTKGVPVEATAILARQFPDRLAAALSPAELEQARDFLYRPGISVLRDAQTALAAGRVTAMHDPTEGGLATALWELAEASGNAIEFDPAAVLVPEVSKKICREFGLDPLGTIASGALLFSAAAGDAVSIRKALESEGILCMELGQALEGPPAVWQRAAGSPAGELLARPARDEIARLF